MASAGANRWAFGLVVAAFLAVALYAVRFAPVRLTPVHAAIAGVVVALLYLTRSFELAALIAAWAGVFVLLAALRLTEPRAWRTAHLVSAVVAFVATTVVVYAVTGKRDVFLLYGNYLDRQSGNVGSAEVAETPTFSLSLVPTKLVQLFGMVPLALENRAAVVEAPPISAAGATAQPQHPEH